MPTPSKFTAERRRLVLEAISVGASRKTAAAHARVDYATLRRWLDQGESAQSDSAFRKFHEDLLEAESQPRLRALGVVQNAMIDKPDIAWKFIERREEGYAPPMPDRAPAVTQQVVVLTLDDGRPLVPALPKLVVNEADESDQPASA